MVLSENQQRHPTKAEGAKCCTMMQTLPLRGLQGDWHSAQPPWWDVQNRWYQRVFRACMPLNASLCLCLPQESMTPLVVWPCMQSALCLQHHHQAHLGVPRHTCLLVAPEIPRLAEEDPLACRVHRKGQNRSCKCTRHSPLHCLTSCASYLFSLRSCTLKLVPEQLSSDQSPKIQVEIRSAPI